MKASRLVLCLYQIRGLVSIKTLISCLKKLRPPQLKISNYPWCVCMHVCVRVYVCAYVCVCMCEKTGFSTNSKYRYMCICMYFRNMFASVLYSTTYCGYGRQRASV